MKIGKNIAAVQGDVSNLKDLDRLYAKIAQEKGRVDIVFARSIDPFDSPSSGSMADLLAP